jgi:hypothetical protein
VGKQPLDWRKSVSQNKRRKLVLDSMKSTGEEMKKAAR